MSDANRHLMTVFTAARGLPPGSDRATYLDRACAGAAVMRAEVEALLRAHEHANGFLEPPEHLRPTEELRDPASSTEFETGDAEVGTMVARRYRLLEKIGVGGMGAVGRAEQTEPVRREVALKVIKRGMDSEQVLARFEAERQALALMDHPGIAKVLDGGTTAGRRRPAGRSS